MPEKLSQEAFEHDEEWTAYLHELLADNGTLEEILKIKDGDDRKHRLKYHKHVVRMIMCQSVFNRCRHEELGYNTKYQMACGYTKPSKELNLPACRYCVHARIEDFKNSHYNAIINAEGMGLTTRRIIATSDMIDLIIKQLDLHKPDFMKVPTSDTTYEFVFAAPSDCNIGEDYTQEMVANTSWEEWTKLSETPDHKNPSGKLGKKHEEPIVKKEEESTDEKPVKIKSQIVSCQGLSEKELLVADNQAIAMTIEFNPTTSYELEKALELRNEVYIGIITAMGATNIVTLSKTKTIQISRCRWLEGVKQRKVSPAEEQRYTQEDIEMYDPVWNQGDSDNSEEEEEA